MSVEALAVPTLLTAEQQLSWTFWPVSYQFGDPTVITNRPLPLSGVELSEIMRGTGELRGALQLADDEVRALNPWDVVVPRKTGIVSVRSHFDPTAAAWVHVPHQHYVVWAAPRNPDTGRMDITAQTVESLWARRLITREIVWDGVDQAAMVADLLDPAAFSLVDVGADPWPGWITVDPPANVTGVVRDFTYEERQETNLLEAHQNRSQVANGYEWRTSVRVLAGSDAVSASTFRLQYVLGFPQLGRQLGDLAALPRLRYDVRVGGNVVDFTYRHDGTQVPNITWGRGSGYEDLQVKSLITNNEWESGFLQTETRFSDPDIKLQDTLDQRTAQHMWEKWSSERYLSDVTIRGDLPPYFGSYQIGDDVILDTNDVTWPDYLRGPDGFVTLAGRVYGWRITPPQGNSSELIKLVISGGVA